jgi:hypothetical protein
MVTVDATCTTDVMKPSEKSESEEYMMGDAYRVAKQAYDKKDKTMTTRDAGLTKDQVEAAEVHAAGSSHCGEIKSKSAFSRDSTLAADAAISLPFGWIEDGAVDKVLHLGWSPIYLRLETTTHKGDVVCKALACAGGSLAGSFMRSASTGS